MTESGHNSAPYSGVEMIKITKTFYDNHKKANLDDII